MEKTRQIALCTIQLIFCIITPAWAEEDDTVCGTVVDSTDRSPLANVYVCLYEGKRMLAYTFSDADGRFRISVDKAMSPDRLTASLIGYAVKNCNISGANSLTVKMTRRSLDLNPVTVTAPAITRDNDTVNYYMDAFRSDTDISLKQVLLKLPGIEVTKNGTVYHKGKAINKFYIEGMDMLGNRYSVATENLDPRRIAKVQVIENHQPVKALDGLSVSDRSAVNIVLKSDAKGAWLLSADAAGGYMEDTSALAKGRLWLANFRKKSQSMIMLKGNNTGESVTDELRRMDYWGRQGIIVHTPGSLDTDFEGPFDIRRKSTQLPDRYCFDNMSAILSANHIRTDKHGTILRFNLQGAAERWQEKEAESQTVLFNDGNTFEISETGSREDRKLYLDAGLDIESNTARAFINNSLSVSGQFRHHESLLEAGTSYGHRYMLPSLKVENNLISTVRVNPKRALNVNSTIKAVFNSHNFILNSSTHQDTRYTDITADNSVSAVFRAGRFVFDVCGNLDLGYFRRSSSLGNIQPDLSPILYGDTDNSLDMLSLTPSAEVSATWHKGPLNMRMKVPAGFEYMRIRDSGNASNRIYPVLSPSIMMEWIIVADLKATVEGSWSLSDGNVDDLISGYILKNYRTASKAGIMPALKNFHSDISLSYSSVLSELGASVRVGYDKGSSSSSLSAIYFDNLTLSETVERLSTMESAYGGVTFRKWFGPKTFSITMDALYRQNRISMFLQERYSDYCTEIITARAEIESRPSDWLDVSASFAYTRSRFISHGSEPVHSFLTEGNVVITPVRHFSLSGSVFHLYQKIPGTSVTNTPLLKLSAEYRFKKFRIFVECTNLLNATEFRRESIDAYSAWQSSFSMRPRSYLAGIGMSF